ncbi:MAG: cytochrome P450 [Chloroflexota bacterium]
MTQTSIPTAQKPVTTMPQVGVFPDIFGKSPFAFLRDAALEGDLVQIKAGPIKVFLVSGADEFQYVLRDKQPNFIKSPKLYDAAKMMIGNGLVTSNGDFWLRQRRMIQPYFHRQQIANFTQMMVDGIADVLDTWQDGEERELKNSMSQITIEVISRTMFGENVVSEKEMQQVADDLVFLADYVALRGYMPFIPLSMPVPGHGRYKAAMARLHKIVERIIVLGEQTPESGNLISMLVHATDEETNG